MANHLAVRISLYVVGLQRVLLVPPLRELVLLVVAGAVHGRVLALVRRRRMGGLGLVLLPRAVRVEEVLDDAGHGETGEGERVVRGLLFLQLAYITRRDCGSADAGCGSEVGGSSFQFSVFHVFIWLRRGG